MAASRTGVLIVRVRIEEGSALPLRAHVRLTDDITSGVERSVTLTGADAVCEVVREWLGEMLAEHDGG
ncbi:hypothetical protein ACFV1B_05440 [Streptomyces sp. NPDC059637]|nr:hypothetical protein [Streptomyces sp. HB2AG]MCZ2525286.1 hypothetical protein [Streptomyces sp. HB2AG]